MKRSLVLTCVLAVLATAPLFGHSVPAYAGNSAVESTLSNYGDVSMFYQALLTTGVINELNENTHYTIFAPTNAAFSEITAQKYPCFYSEQCRAQVAVILRNHIVSGAYTLAELTKYGQGLQTLGPQRLVVTEQYRNSYTVNGQTILSDGDTGSNMVYRINGVLADPQELAQFRTVSVAPAVALPPEDVVTQRTVTRRTYDVVNPATGRYPAGTMDPAYPVDPQDNVTETTTVIKRYTTEQ